MYQQALHILGTPTSSLALQARFGLGQIQLAKGDVLGASGVFTAIVSDVVTTTVATDALTRLGYLAAKSGETARAVSYYETALRVNPVITPNLALWIGDAYISAKQPVSAVVPYRMAVAGAPTAAQTILRREKLALALSLTGQFTESLQLYQLNIENAQYAITRVRNQFAAAQVMVAMGLDKQGYQRMREIADQYPSLPTAVVAMQELDKAGRNIDDLQRGVIYYHAGENLAAQQAFRRAIATEKRLNEVRYWAALNYADMGSNIDALRNLNQIIAEGPGTTRYGDAMVEKGILLQSAGDEDGAVAVFRQLAAQAPSDSQAPQALGRIALLYERYGQLELAAQAYQAASNAYSLDPSVAEYMLRGAVMLYRLGRYPESTALLQTMLARYPTAPEHDLMQLWLGKGQLAAGDVVTGQATLSQLAVRVPDSYEGTRAAEIAADRNRVPLSKPFGKPLTPTVESSARAQQAAEDWLRGQANISATVDIRTISPTISANQHFRRGTYLWRLGFTEEATDEFDGLRDDLGNNPIGMYQAALYLRDLGAYRESISTGAALLRAVNATNVSDAPAFLGQLVYPLYFADLIFSEASTYALDPLLIASLIRQESLFETFAASTASAYGLMQVVPATGKEINTALGWPQNYNEQDLLRPWVSVRFGAYYLAHQRDALKGDLYATLAAYNGGPGMALRWRERSGGDPDAFFLTVPLDGAGYRETQLYLRTVTTNYAIYHRLYAGD